MVRAAALIAFIVATGAQAQSTQTDCSWVGNTWTCRSSSPSGGVLDQGSILKSGADLVKPYVPPQPVVPPINPPVVLPPLPTQRPQSQTRDTDRDRAFVMGILPHCSVRGEVDDEQTRKVAAVICIAYEQGKADGIVATVDALRK